MDIIENMKIFRRVAETGSFSGVAKEMGVTQPTISKAIAALEVSLEVALVRRSTRGLSLTGEGQKLLYGGSKILDELGLLLSSVKNEGLQLNGQLRVTASLAFARLILAPLFCQFHDLHPNLKFHFQLSDGSLDLVENNIDLALRIGELPDSSMKALKIGASRRCLFASQGYIKKNGMPAKLADLHQHRLLYYTRLSDRPLWPLNHEDGSLAPFAFEPYLRSDGSDLVRESVLNGLGIALLPTWMMLEPMEKNLVQRVLESNSESRSNIYVLSANATEMSAKQRVFAEFLKQKFDKIPELSLR